MSRRPPTLPSALLLPGLLIAFGATAAPVLQSEETTPTQPVLSASPDNAGPAASPLLSGESTLPVDDSPSGAAPTRSAAPQVGGARTRAAGQAALPGSKPGAAMPATAANSAQIDPDMKEAAKAALELAHEIKEMVQPAGSEAADQGPAAASRVASGSAGRTVDPAVGSAADPEPSLVYLPPVQQATRRGQGAGAEIDLVHEAIKVVKEILENPLTWLLGVLVVLGTSTVSFMQWRAAVDRRRYGGRGTRHRHGSSRPSGERLQDTSLRSTGTPLAAPRSGDAPARTRRRRSAKA